MSEDNTVATEEKQNVELSISDIQNAVAIIDFACEQGAFKGWATIEQVLTVRARLKAFVDVASASSEAETAETETTETPAAE